MWSPLTKGFITTITIHLYVESLEYPQLRNQEILLNIQYMSWNMDYLQLWDVMECKPVAYGTSQALHGFFTTSKRSQSKISPVGLPSYPMMSLLRQKKDQKLPQKEDWLQQPPKNTSQVRPISKNGGIEWYRLKCSVFFGVSWIIIFPLYPMKTSMDKYKTLPN